MLESSDLRRVLREDGVGGSVERELTNDVIADAARRFSSLICQEGGGAVALGRDCRLTSVRFHGLVSSVLRDAGIDVVDLGLAPTPLLCHAVVGEKLQGGVQVTGGVGLAVDNGLRLYRGGPGLPAVSGQRLLEVSGAGPTGRMGNLRRSHSRGAFLAGLERLLVPGRGVSVVVDCGHGAVGPVLLPLLRRAGFRVHEERAEMDGRFPTRSPDPFEAKALAGLAACVRSRGAWLGFSFDPVGARLAVVDERGDPVWHDSLLLLLADAILESAPGGTIAVDYRSSPQVLAGLEALKAVAIMSPPGPGALRERVHSAGAILGGDLDGHLVFGGDAGGYEDALGAALRLLALVVARGAPLSRLSVGPSADLVTRQTLVPCPAALRREVLKRVALRAGSRAELLEEVLRIQLDGGWGVVWPHPWRPALAFRAGATTREARALVQNDLEGEIKTARAEVAAGG